MAETTSLGFNIFARNMASKVFKKAANDAQKMRRDAEAAGNGFGSSAARVTALTTAITALSSGGLPVLAGVAAGAGALSAPLAAAGVGFAAVGAVAVPALSDISEAMQLQKQAAEGNEAAQKKLKEALGEMSPAARTLMGDVVSLKDEYGEWAKSLQPQVLPLFSQGIGMVSGRLTSLNPLVISSSGAISGLLTSLDKSLKAPFWDEFGERMESLAPTAISGLGKSGGNVVGGLAGIVNAFMPYAPGMLQFITDITARFREWGQGLDGNPAFQAFMGYVVANGPTILSILSSLVSTITNIIIALSPFGPLVLNTLGVLSRVLAAIPPDVLFAIGTAIGVVVAAWKAWTVALWLWNAAFAVTPLGWIVIAIVAVIAIIVWAWTKFGWFRDGVLAVWNAIKTGALWLWQNAIQPAFAGIMIAVRAVGAAALWLWNAAIVPAFAGIRAAITWLGTAAMWLWSTILGPVFSFIWAAVKIVAVAILTLLVAPSVIAFNILSAAAMWLWNNALGPALRGIAALALWLWTNALQPAWAGIMVGVRAVGAVFRWLYTAVVLPVFGWIRAYIAMWWLGVRIIWAAVRAYVIGPLASIFRWLWNAVIRPVWNGIRAAIRGAWAVIRAIWGAIRAYILGPLAAIFRWLWASVIRPIWSGIRATISAVWNGGIKPVFRALREGVKAIWKAFQTAKRYITTAWRGIRDSAKKPVNFLIGTVYNDGIRKVWNKIAGIVGAKEIGKVKGFSRGGIRGRGRDILPGTSTWRQGDDQLVPMRRGEGVYMSEVMRDPYERARLQMMNGYALRGILPSAVRARLGEEFGEGAGHAKGGLVGAAPHARTTLSGGGAAKGGWLGVNSISPPKSGILEKVGSFVKDVAVDVFTGDMGGAIDKVFAPMKTATGMFGKKGLPGAPYMAVGKLNKSVKKWLVDKWESFMASFGGGGGAWVGLASASERLKRAARWAQRQHGKPYVWGGVFRNGGSGDCSGFMGAIENVIRGVGHHRRYTTHAFGGSPPAGWVRNLRSPFTVGVRHGGPGGGHMAGTLLGKNVESGGRGVRVGSSARGTRSFPNRFGFRPVVGDTGKSSAGPSASHGRASTFDGGGVLAPGLNLLDNKLGHPEPLVRADMHPGGDIHVHIHGNVYAKSAREFEDLVVGAVSEAQRKGRLRRGTA